MEPTLPKKTSRQSRRPPKEANDIFLPITHILSREQEGWAHIAQALAAVCKHFAIGNGFIYETDHTDHFHLIDSYFARSPYALPESLRIGETFRAQEIVALRTGAPLCTLIQGDTAREDDSLAQIFHASSLMVLPVLGPDTRLVGFIGVSERRASSLAGCDAIREALCAALTMLAPHIKLRIAYKQLNYYQNTLHGIMDHVGVDIYVNDLDTHEMLYLNRSMAAPYGDPAAAIGRPCWDVLYDDKTSECEYCPRRLLFDEAGNPTRTHTWEYQRPFDGAWFRVHCAAFPWVDGRMAHVISSTDITRNKANEALITRMAQVDELTQLPNRRKLLADLTDRVEAGAPFGLIFFDLDHLKQINDTMGHKAGDELLSNVGARLARLSAAYGVGYRHSGDEFVLLLPHAQRAHAQEVAALILAEIKRPHSIQQSEVCVSASVGIALFPQDGDSVDEILHNADTAMYRAKEDGRDQYAFFS